MENHPCVNATNIRLGSLIRYIEHNDKFRMAIVCSHKCTEIYDFNYVKSNFRNLKIDDTQIKIDISGTEIVFILENSYKEEPIVVEEETEEEEIKETFFSKLKNLLTSKKSS